MLVNKIYTFFKGVFFKLPFSLQAYISRFIFKPKFGMNMTISSGSKFYYGDVSFGNGSRIAANSFFANISVGNYTVFSQDFRVLPFLHDYSAFSINSIIPEKIKAYNFIGGGGVKNLHEPRIINYPQTVIGSDVWIGEFVTVKGGCHIGDGAVVGARSVVTHDIPPFAIVAGVPARIIGWRFDEMKIELMKKIKWWDWDLQKISDNYEKLCNFDPSLADVI